MKTTLALLLFAFSFLLFSCYTPRYVYSPSAQNIPVFTKKGDNKLAANYSFNLADNSVKDSIPVRAKARGYDLQAAYAFSNHWAMQLNYYHRTERNARRFNSGYRDSVVVNYKRNLTEIGLGYFSALDKNKWAYIQVFAGVGFGRSSFTDNGRDYNSGYRTRFHSMNVSKIFIQPALILKGTKNFAASLSSRFSIVYFSKINTDYSTLELSNYTLDSLSYSPRVFWEPCVVNTFGFKKLPGLRVELQGGFAFLASHRFVDARTFNFSVGLLFDLPKIFALNQRSSKN